MGSTRPHLDLRPERCDQCGACLDVCSDDALKLGRGFIYVDWPSCGTCIACAEACEAGAITVKGSRPTARRVTRTEGAVTTISQEKESAPSYFARAMKEAAPVARPKASDTVAWSTWEIVAVLVVAAALLVARDFALGSDFARDLEVHGLVAFRAAVQSVYYGVLLGLLAILARRRGIGFRKAFGLSRRGGSSRAAVLVTSAWVVAALFVTRLVSTMYGTIAQGLGWEPPTAGVAELTDWFGTDILGLALATVTIVVLGPFVEEIVFRGMVLSGLQQKLRTPLAITVSALLFATSHLTLWTFVPLTVLGLAAGWLVTTRGSVWPAVVLHSLYNAVAVFAAFYVAGAVGG